MSEQRIDYQAVFRILPGALAVLTPDGVILDVNEGFLEAGGRTREQVLGRSIFDAFPQNPLGPGDAGPPRLRHSLRSVADSGEPDVIAPIRYDVEVPGAPGEFEERYWAVVNTPMRDRHGQVTMIIHKADEITHIVNEARHLLADYG